MDFMVLAPVKVLSHLISIEAKANLRILSRKSTSYVVFKTPTPPFPMLGFLALAPSIAASKTFFAMTASPSSLGLILSLLAVVVKFPCVSVYKYVSFVFLFPALWPCISASRVQY